MEPGEKFTLWDDLTNADTNSDTDNLAAKVAYLQTLEGGPQGYRLRRVILCNFWLYGLQEFEIPHGRLFLAGENASGKSSVLAAALPLALDGNLSPNRLDTFGSRQRKIDYYVLGSAESSTPYQYERRTTYIALEFEWCDPVNPPIAPDIRQHWLEARTAEEREKARWLTIGLSLAGNNNANEKVRPIRFLITDGSRFGHELGMIDQKNVAYDQLTFKRLLSEGGRGIICDTVADYQSHVARYLFGTSEVRDFQNIISMMLVVRQPNLGTEINFTRVHEYLKQALPRIPDEITRRVTGTLERMDNIQTQLEHLQEAYEAATVLDKAAQKLAVAGARRSGLSYLLAQTSENGFQTRVTGLERTRANAETALKAAEAAYAALNTEDEQVAGQLAALEASESLQVVDKIAAARSQTQEALRHFEQQTTQLEGARQALQAVQTRQERLTGQHLRWQEESRQTLKALETLAEKEAEWPLAAGQLEGLAQLLTAYNLESENQPELPLTLAALAGQQSEERLNKLSELEELHRERESKAIEARIATARATEKRNEYDELRQRRDEAQQRVAEVRDELANRWRQFQREPESWTGELPDYRLAELASNALRATLEEYRALVQAVTGELSRAVMRLDETHSQLLQGKGSQQTRLAELEREFARKKAEPDRLPLRTVRRQTARELLAQRQIRALPFYALLDFKPNLTGPQAGQIEFMLEEAGLLDGLVVHRQDYQTAQEILAASNLSDAFLRPLENSSESSNLTGWLVYAAPRNNATGHQADWQSTVEELLKALPVDLPNEETALHWQHGLLTGRSVASQAPGFIGLANRERLRQEELAGLEKRLNHAQTELINLENQVRQNRQRQQALAQEQTRLDQLYRAEAVVSAETDHDRIETERQKSERGLSEAQNQEREARQQLNSVTTRILQASADIPGAASDQRHVRALLEATRRLKNEAARLQQSLGGATDRWHEHRENQSSLEAASATVQLAASLHAESQARATRSESELAELEKLLETSDLQAQVERLAYLRERRKGLPQELQKAALERGKAEERLHGLLETLEQALQNLAEARQKRQVAQTTFALKLAFYPAAALIEARTLAGKDDALKAANTLLKGEENSLPDEETLESAYDQASRQLLAEFTRQRSFLVDYGPDLDDETRIVFLAEDHIEIPALLNLLANRIELQRTLLVREETSLFEDFLLQEMAEAIRSHIIQASDWLDNINRVLNNLPMVGERYSLDWKPLDASEIAEGSGSHIARHHRLLSRPVQSLTPEERQLIQDALRLEIAGLRLRQKDEPGLSFMEALVQIFDYREWFRFGVFITPQGGNRIRLTDRNAGTRSGAEQLFALYVPLFAALAALYGSYAAPGSPRLLALDEAFDKSSLANTQKIMQFLVLQGFQWIMTGPQVSGMGSGVPVSAEYQMLHEKGTNVATSVPFYWIAGQSEATND